MKKILVLAIAFMVIGLTVVSAQNNARLQQLQNEAQQIAAKFQRGQTLTPAEQQKLIDLNVEMIMLQAPGTTREQATAMAQQMMQQSGAMSPQQVDDNRRLFEQGQELQRQNEQAARQEQQQQQEQQRFLETQQQQQQAKLPGETAGWPRTARLRDFGLSNLKQPAGIQPSYDDFGGKTGLTLFMTGANANTLQDVKQQIETAFKKHMSGSNNQYQIQVSAATRTTGAIWLNLRLEENQITIYFHESAG
jgi:basic membrane lipoprotein Med (substrate-binding protein (PBP1-ABC) superfamily)